MTQFSYSRRAFRQAILLRTDAPLLTLYCELVELELALKAYSKSFFKDGHDLPTMLGVVHYGANVQEALRRDRTRSFVGTTLHNALLNRLVEVAFLDKKGHPQKGCADNYPHLRYVRHDTDLGPSDREREKVTSDSQIKNALQTVIDIKRVLASAGIV